MRKHTQEPWPEFAFNLRQQLLTQDGRCTADPFFVVFSKREVVVDEDYDYDRIVWCREDDGGVEATEHQHRRLEVLHRNYREPEGWRRLAIKEIDQFETACFTEKGCKDYLEANGHNLRKPFIYAHSLYRNREMLELRKMLMTGNDAEEGGAVNHFPDAAKMAPDGWQLVPVAATKAMWAAWDSAPCNNDDDAVNLECAYQAMLAAAPKLGGE